MATELKQKIGEMVKKYWDHEEGQFKALEQVLEKFKSASYRERFTRDGLRMAISEEIRGITNEGEKTEKVMNQLLKATIQDTRKLLIPAPVKKGMEYSLQISNALRFLELEGDDLTDEIAHSILKDFLADLPQMELFERMVRKQLRISPQECERIFAKTFGKLHQFQFLLNTFAALEAIAENLFVHPKVNGQEIIINLDRFALPMSGYSERSQQDEIMNLAEIVDRIADPLHNRLELMEKWA